MSFTTPNPLKVLIVAPSSLCDAPCLQAAYDALISHNCLVSLNDVIKDACKHGKKRLDCKNNETLWLEALENKTDILWVLRGGYGASRILPFLYKLKPYRQSAWFIGSSDATALHIFFNQQWGWETIHGVMLAANKDVSHATSRITVNAETSLNSVLQLIKDVNYSYNLLPLNKVAYDCKNVAGKLLGGNLSLVCATLGTPNQLRINDGILLLEDVSESPERVERMLLQLDQAGLFAQASAVCFGQFSYPSAEDETCLHHPLLASFLESLAVPCFEISIIGHAAVNMPVILGRAHRITQSQKNIWKIKA